GRRKLRGALLNLDDVTLTFLPRRRSASWSEWHRQVHRAPPPASRRATWSQREINSPVRLEHRQQDHSQPSLVHSRIIITRGGQKVAQRTASTPSSTPAWRY